MTSSGGPGEVLVRFPTHPHSIRTARSLVVDALRSWDLGTLADDARLVVSELATNAVLHSGGRTFELSLALTGARRCASPSATTGRCLRRPWSGGRDRPAGRPPRLRPETDDGARASASSRS